MSYELIKLVYNANPDKALKVFEDQIRADQTRNILELLRRDDPNFTDDDRTYHEYLCGWLETKLGEMKLF